MPSGEKGAGRGRVENVRSQIGNARLHPNLGQPSRRTPLALARHHNPTMLSWITGSSLAAPTQDLPVSLPKEAPLPPLPVAPTLPPSDPLPAPVQPSQRPSTRKEVNPNAPYVILACAGVRSATSPWHSVSG